MGLQQALRLNVGLQQALEVDVGLQEALDVALQANSEAGLVVGVFDLPGR